MKGKVIKYFPDKGFGFIKLEDGNDCYFHKSKIEGEIEHIYPGDIAEVECRESRKKPGSFEASQVLFLPGANQEKNRTELPMEIGQIEMIDEQRGFGFMATIRFGSVYFNFRILSGDRSFIQVNESALITVRTSIKKTGSYEAVTLRPLATISLVDIISDNEQIIREEEFDLCMRFLREKSRVTRESVSDPKLHSFFARLSEDQRERAFNSWYYKEIVFFDSEYLSIKLPKMSAYDALETISRTEKTPIGEAFKLLPDEKKYDLVTGVLQGKQSYFVESYFCTIMGDLSLEEVIKIVEEGANKNGIKLVTEYLKLHYKGDFNSPDLKILINVLKSSRYYDESKSVDLYMILRNYLSYQQKYDLMMHCKNKGVMILDSDFLFSNLDTINIHIRFSLLKSLDEESADLLIKRSLNEIADSPGQFSTDDIIKSLEALRVWNREYDLTNFEDILKLNYSQEDQFEFWKNGLIREIDLEIILMGSRALNAKELSRVFNFVSEKDRKTFIFNSIATTLEDGLSLQSTKVFDILKLCASDPTLLFEVIFHLIDSLPEPLKDTLAQSSYFDALNDEQLQFIVNHHLSHDKRLAPMFVSKIILRSFENESMHEIVFRIIERNKSYYELLNILALLSTSGLCYFKTGKYQGESVVSVWKRNPAYIGWLKKNTPGFLASINNLAICSPKLIEQIEDKTLMFIGSIILPVINKIDFDQLAPCDDLRGVVSIYEQIISSHYRPDLFRVDSNSILSRSLEKYFESIYHSVVQEIEDCKNGEEIKALKLLTKRLANLISVIGKAETKPKFRAQAKVLMEMIDNVYSDILINEFNQVARDQINFMDYLNLFQSLLSQNRYDKVVINKQAHSAFYTGCNRIIANEITEFREINSIYTWNRLREKIARLKPTIDNLFPPAVFGACPFINELELIRDHELKKYLIDKPTIIDSLFRYSKAVEIINQLQNSYNVHNANLLIKSLYDHSTYEIQLRLWLYEYVDIFDFEKFAEYYFTLTKEERRLFNKRVRSILRIELDKKLLKVRVPCVLIKQEESISIFKATWKSIWFNDGFLRFCMDDGIFSEAYKWSFSSRDFNSLYDYFSGKRLPDLTVYSQNGVIVDVEGLDEIEIFIKKMSFLKEIEKNPEYIIKGEGENRVPRNILLRNDCIRILGNLSKEGTKVFRVYERVYTQKLERWIVTDFDTSYLFSIELNHPEFAIVWESVEFEKSKATYVFKCHSDELSTTLNNVIMYVNTTIHVRSTLLRSEEDQQQLGFVGRIEHENFNLKSWISGLITYLPERENEIKKQLELSISENK